jgi:hypothetical protein
MYILLKIYMYHLAVPALGTYFYLNLKSYVPRLHPWDISVIAFFHNLGLAIFSGIVFTKMTGILLRLGIVFQAEYYFADPEFDRIILVFYLSKYYEYADTYLIYLKNKTPIFLQRYHHIGAVIVWHFCYVYKVDCIWMATLVNALVHTVMYSYYASTVLKLDFIRNYKKYITGLQIAQLALANIVSPVMYYPPVESWFNYGIIMGFNAYVLLLVYLFVGIF